MSATGLYQRFDDVWLLDGVRTPMVDYNGALTDASPTDMGIKVAREILARTDVNPQRVDSVLAGNMAPGGFDQFYVPRHIGLYAGVPLEVPALMVQRICGTGFELFRQAVEAVEHHGAEDADRGLLETAAHRHHDGVEAAEQRGEREQVGQDVDALAARPRPRELVLGRLRTGQAGRALFVCHGVCGVGRCMSEGAYRSPASAKPRMEPERSGRGGRLSCGFDRRAGSS